MWKNYEMSRTGLVTTIAVIALMVYDLAVVLFSGTGSSISNFLINAGVRSPVICFGLGWIMCHLLGGQMFIQKEQKDDPVDLSQVKKCPE